MGSEGSTIELNPLAVIVFDSLFLVFNSLLSTTSKRGASLNATGNSLSRSDLNRGSGEGGSGGGVCSLAQRMLEGWKWLDPLCSTTEKATGLARNFSTSVAIGMSE